MALRLAPTSFTGLGKGISVELVCNQPEQRATSTTPTSVLRVGSMAQRTQVCTETHYHDSQATKPTHQLPGESATVRNLFSGRELSPRKELHHMCCCAGEPRTYKWEKCLWFHLNRQIRKRQLSVTMTYNEKGVLSASGAGKRIPN